MAIESVNPSLYADPAALGGLKRQAAAGTPEGVREVARQFESLFTTMMLKSMRSASMGDPMFGSQQADFYQDMFDQQLALELGKGRGLGLAEMLMKQLMTTGGNAAAGNADVDAVSAAPPAGAAADMPGFRDKDDFVAAIRPAAEAAARELGVDADTVIAHAALETGWGRHMPGNNLFGIKAGSTWNGAAVTLSTQEFSAGRMQRTDADFRAYASPEQSIRDYVGVLKNPRYAAALGTGSDVSAFARGLARGGYATDPDYVSKLTAVAARLKGGDAAPINTTTTT